jgi:hypothetical protein
MHYYNVIENKNFVNRHREWKRLDKIVSLNKAAIIVVHGRRRVGKTELTEQYFRKYNILKFEGIQSDPEKKNSKKADTYQIQNCIRLLGKYLNQESVYNKIVCHTWTEFFELINPVVEKESVVLYFEEVQWIANYKYQFMAELKPFWDNYWRHNNNLIIVFSGSSPSFMVGQFISNMAMYNRSQYEFSLEPFNLMEIKEFMCKNRRIGNREIMLTAITIGGICGYLERIVDESSVLNGLCINAFEKDSFFSKEYDRIFVSSMASNKYYKKILEFLSKKKFATRQEIIHAVSKNKQSSGGFTNILKDLESCGFVQKYVPVTHHQNSLLARYFIADEYLQFYLKFIHPCLAKINNGTYHDHPKKALNMNSFNIVMGFAFERWCRKNERLFAKIMNFGDVAYDAGSFFNQKTAKQDKGFQIDLLYIRADHKIIICEIKYLDAEITVSAGREIRRKLNIFQEQHPKYKNYTFETALITTEKPVQKDSINEYFDHIITFDDIFNAANWKDYRNAAS